MLFRPGAVAQVVLVQRHRGIEEPSCRGRILAPAPLESLQDRRVRRVLDEKEDLQGAVHVNGEEREGDLRQRAIGVGRRLRGEPLCQRDRAGGVHAGGGDGDLLQSAFPVAGPLEALGNPQRQVQNGARGGRGRWPRRCARKADDGGENP